VLTWLCTCFSCQLQPHLLKEAILSHAMKMRHRLSFSAGLFPLSTIIACFLHLLATCLLAKKMHLVLWCINALCCTSELLMFLAQP
jgi:hypothetical protein